MFRSLTGALLPLVAFAVRGKDDGSDRENAKDVWSINNSGDGIWWHMYHWTSVEADGSKMWNGDIVVHTRESWKNLAIGFCMEILDTDDKDFDCLRAVVDGKPTGSLNSDPT